MINLRNVSSNNLKDLLFIYLVVAIGLYGAPGLTIFPMLVGVLLTVVFFINVVKKKVKLFFFIPIKIFIIFFILTLFSTIIFFTSWALLFTIFQVSLLLIVISSILLNSNSYDFYYWGVTFGCLLVIFLHVIDGRPLLTYDIVIEERLGGTSGNVNDYAFSMCTAINLLLFSFYDEAKKKNMFYWNILKLIIILLFVIEITYFTLSKTGVIVMLFSLIIFSFNYFKKSSFIRNFLIGIAVLLLVNLSTIEMDFSVFERFQNMYESIGINSRDLDGSTSQRSNLIIEGIRLWSERPLLGWGSGQYRWINKVYPGYYSHNNFIEILVNFGLLGFFIFYSIHYYLFMKLFKLKKMKQRTNEINWLLVILFSLIIIDVTFVTYYNKIYIINLAFILVNVKKLEKYFKLKRINQTNLN